MAPTTAAAPAARGGDGWLPPIRSAATRFRKSLILSLTSHRYDLEPDPLRERERLRDLDPPPDDDRERPDDELPRLRLDPVERPLAEALPRLRLELVERRLEEEPPRLRLDPVDFCRAELSDWLGGLCACSRSWMSSKSA